MKATLRLLAVLLFVGERIALAATCERLQQSLTYTQEEAPRDLSGVLPAVVERINRVLEGVVDVEVEWHGHDLQGRVGEHTVQCKVTRLSQVLKTEAAVTSYTDESGRSVVTQCFHVPFTILDTNECSLPPTHPMRHQCHASSICVNTIGSYECLCPAQDASRNPAPGTTVKEDTGSSFWAAADGDRNEWERAVNRTSLTTCPGAAFTHGCCPVRGHSRDGAACRLAFTCPTDPCRAAHDCAARATCERALSPLAQPTNYHCTCPAGLMGNGHACRANIDRMPPAPKVMFDGVTPTEETVKQNYYCDCTRPVVDACSGFPVCQGKHEICIVGAGNSPRCGCKPGYVMHETYGCVDESPPFMKLKHDPYGDQTLRLKQGDVYKEHFVDIQDENAEEYLRSLKIAYSIPMPYGCLTDIGEFHVNYTVATPWTSPPYVRLTRRVIIEDINECLLDAAKYEQTCPPLVPKCDTEVGAKCANTIGSYTCQCPKHTEGDGFLTGLSFKQRAPTGFDGGTGCRDTSVPVITLVGPNPKIFSVCRCGGVKGVMHLSDESDKDADLSGQQQRHYGADIREMIRDTAGAELCATHNNAKPAAADCARAYDETYKGRVDLSKKVKVGQPVQKSGLHWSVPYDVTDEAGNKAATVWRDVVVEEVELDAVEARMRRELEKEKDAAVRKAVDMALINERKQTSGTNRRSSSQKCPTCPACDCQGSGGGMGEAACLALCETRIASCAVDELSFAFRMILWLEGYIPSSLAPLVLGLTAIFGVLLFLRFVISFFAEQRAYRPVYDTSPENLQNHVTVYHPANGHASNGGNTFHHNGVPQSAPPRSSASLGAPREGGNGSLFTPTSRGGGAAAFSPSAGVRPSPVPDIYEQSPLISPNRRGEGVRRRSPYSH